jgi:putative NIF3 family GTP cyclohydrolase 1 type 2
LEVVCPKKLVAGVVKAMRQAHSYEEPAYDIYPLMKRSSSGHEGRVGALPQPAKIEEIAEAIRRSLASGPVQIVGDRSREATQVAIACGAAGEFLDDAKRSGADLFLTGEMRFHDYLKAKDLGIALILPGHYATERFAVEELAARLKNEWPGLSAWESRRECDPVSWC